MMAITVWGCFAHLYSLGYESKPWYLVNHKTAGKWMFIPLKLILIGFDPSPLRLVILLHLHHPIFKSPDS